MADPHKIYIDSCCFISLANYKLTGDHEHGRDKDNDYLSKILHAAYDDRLALFTSTLTIAECLCIKKQNVKVYTDDVQKKFNSILLSGFIRHISPDIFVTSRARDLLWKHNITGLESADSIHIASALSVGCKEFITLDGVKKRKGLLKLKGEFVKVGLSIVLPSETKYLPGEYLQENLGLNAAEELEDE